MAPPPSNPPPPSPGPRRLGPRPLPLHLAMQTMMWLSSYAALAHLKNGSLPWKPDLAEKAEALKKDLGAVAPEAFRAAVEEESRRRLAAFADGVRAYRGHRFRRPLEDPPVVWAQGSARLLDYGATLPGAGDAKPLLVVPSLINRAYILDLTEERSLMRYLAGRGFRPLLMDWGTPRAEEAGFSLTDYIAGYLKSALDTAVALAGGPVGVIGYCMGGNLVLPLAQSHGTQVAALVLMATPWDFAAMDPGATRILQAMGPGIEGLLKGAGRLPVDVLQSMFAALDPTLAGRKFQRFAGLDPGSKRARNFVALEDWLNDGVPLVEAVARECLFGWYGENTPGRGAWRIDGRPVRAEDVRVRSLVAIPEHDTIVPPASARALADALPGAERLTIAAGHIGMVAGRGAVRALYEPTAEWLAAALV